MSEPTYGPTVAFDLDKTLAYHDRAQGTDTVGEPIEPMMAVLRRHIAAGHRCVIHTARVCPGGHTPDEIDRQRQLVSAWSVKHLGFALPVIGVKLPSIERFYDDKGVGIVPNTGRRADSKEHSIDL